MSDEMSEADRHLSEAKEALTSAIHHLAELVVHRCSGYDKYNQYSDYKDNIRRVFQELLELRDKLL
jgi:hypothetical protein